MVREGEITFTGVSSLKRPCSVTNKVVLGDLRIVPIIAIDFSMGNLTFGRDINLHQIDLSKPNEYRDLILMIAASYSNCTNLPMFGYGAKTSKQSTKPAAIFPVSRSVRNPFTPNDQETIEIRYQTILEQIEMTLPVNLNPLLLFFK